MVMILINIRDRDIDIDIIHIHTYLLLSLLGIGTKLSTSLTSYVLSLQVTSISQHHGILNKDKDPFHCYTLYVILVSISLLLSL
jgi:hypothetical protein